MRVSIVLWVMVSSLFVAASGVQAQTCFGNVALTSAAPLAVLGAFVGGSGSKTLSTTAFLGNDHLFVGAGVGRDSYDGYDDGSTTVRLQAGGQLRAGGRWHACPYAGASFAQGPDGAAGGFPYEASARWFDGGVSVGVIAHERPGLRIVPAANFAISRARNTIDFGSAFEVEETTSTSQTLAVGVGFQIGERFSIQPAVGRTFSGAGDSNYGLVEVGVSVWRR